MAAGHPIPAVSLLSPPPNSVPATSTPRTVANGVPPSSLPRLGMSEPVALRFGPSTGPYEALVRQKEARISELTADLATERELGIAKAHAHEKLKHAYEALRRTQREWACALDGANSAHRGAALAANETFWAERAVRRELEAELRQRDAQHLSTQPVVAKWMDAANDLKHRVERNKIQLDDLRKQLKEEEELREEAEAELEEAELELKAKSKEAAKFKVRCSCTVHLHTLICDLDCPPHCPIRAHDPPVILQRNVDGPRLSP
jgi:uncharacterized protein YhaN